LLLRQLEHDSYVEDVRYAIMYPLVFELFAIMESTFVDPLIVEKNPCCRGPKQI